METDMKKLIYALLITLPLATHAYDVCGPAITATDIGHTAISQLGDGSIWLGHWAVGNDCIGAGTDEDIVDLCTTVMTGGTAFCSNGRAGAGFDESTATTGSWCTCRRTKVRMNNELIESVGMAVTINVPSNCRANCARLCAESVALNENGMRNPIISLPAM